MTAGTMTGTMTGAWGAMPILAEADETAWTADEAVTRLFSAHYQQLVRLAALLLSDRAVAEELVQDAYVQLHQRWGRLRDPHKALGYLRTSVVNAARSAGRRRTVADRYAASQPPLAHVPSAEHGALGAMAQTEVLAALRALPVRQREALVLRYYMDLSESEIAEVMGISRGAVKSHASRGIAALRSSLEATR